MFVVTFFFLYEHYLLIDCHSSEYMPLSIILLVDLITYRTNKEVSTFFQEIEIDIERVSNIYINSGDENSQR